MTAAHHMKLAAYLVVIALALFWWAAMWRCLIACVRPGQPVWRRMAAMWVFLLVMWSVGIAEIDIFGQPLAHTACGG